MYPIEEIISIIKALNRQLVNIVSDNNLNENYFALTHEDEDICNIHFLDIFKFNLLGSLK